MRQVEFCEKVRVGGNTYHEGDRHTFDDAEAGEYIRLGWAKDPETGEQGDRQPGAQRLKVDPIVAPTGAQ